MVITRRLQRVYIEKTVAGQRYPGQGAIIHRTLQYINILCIGSELVHSHIPEYHTHRGTGFAIGFGIGQIIIDGKPLVMSRRANAPGNVHISVHHVIPKPVQRGNISGIVLHGGHIGHSAIEIHGSDSVPSDFRHLPDRDIVLIIPGIPRPFITTRSMPVPPLFEKPVGKIKILFLPGNLTQFNQRQLNLFMPGHPMPLFGAKGLHHMVGHPDGHIEQFSFSGCLIIGHGSFGHMAGAVHLVLVHIGPALIKTGKRVKGIDIAVGLLRSGKFIDPLVGLLFQSRIRVIDQRIGYPLERFVNIGVVEKDARVGSGSFGRILKIAYSSGLIFNLIDTNLQSNLCMFV